MTTTAITIDEALHRIERQIADLERKADILRQAGNILGEAASTLLSSDLPESGIVQFDASAKRGPTQHEMAKQVLLARGKEMHVGHIAAEIGRTFGVEIKPSYLAPIMHRQIGSLFYKSDKQPNTFGLLEWQANNESSSAERITPPSADNTGGVEPQHG